MALLALAALVPEPAKAQAFTLPEGVGSFSMAWQYVDNTGHRLSGGTLLPAGQSVTTGFLFEMEYGFTDRFSASLGIPYLFAKYTNGEPPPPIPYLPVDSCHCWNSAFQDFSLTARYRLGRDPWAVTPVLRFVQPSHDYGYRGEAVIGRDLQELQVGVYTGTRLEPFLSKASVQAGYTYSFVEKIIGIKNDRSNAFLELGFLATSRLNLRVGANWQHTHGGLRFGDISGNPFPPPGEVDTLDRLEQHDRLLRDNYWRIGGGLSYSAGPLDVFASISSYVWGTDSHDGQAYTVGLTYYFSIR